MTKCCYIVAIIIALATEYDIPPAFALAIVAVESEFNPRAVSPLNRNGTRDWGLFQINDAYFPTDRWYDPYVNAQQGIRHIRWLMDHPWTSTWWSVALAYNAGVTRLGDGRAFPPAALRYADTVMRRFNDFMGGHAPVLIRNRNNQVVGGSR